MNIARLRQPALSAVAVLLISGAGIAFAADPSSAPSNPPVVQGAGAAGAAETDKVQLADQTTPDSQAEKAGLETEKAGSEEPGDQALPGGGHADPADANADHQFDGVE